MATEKKDSTPSKDAEQKRGDQDIPKTEGGSSQNSTPRGLVERKYDRILKVALQRGFFWPSSEIYGGVAGFFDYGPMGALLKRNIEQAWRKLFIIREGMFEIETPTLMPEQVFTASGHIDNFADPLVECTKCKESFRADHVVKEALKIETDGMNLDELNDSIKKNKLHCPRCKSALGEAWNFNLMYKTEAGAGKVKRPIYLRPETAQGMFPVFQRLFQVARKKLPFGACQIGKSYRNEISPRQGMIRLREFTQAEAEIFYNPKEKTHPNFDAVKNHVLPLLTAESQAKDSPKLIDMTAADAVKKGLIASELQAYYLTLSEQFFEQLGIPRTAIRVREQLPSERAHYSAGTWDIEIQSEDFGWIEVCAVADRTDFDVSAHAALSKVDLSANIEGDKFIPHVMEASFGIDRPFYCVLEHAFKEEEKRAYFAIEKNIAPVHVAVFPLLKKDGLPEKAREVFNLLIDAGVHAQYDAAGSIGKRYARSDEVGIPYCITVDHDSLTDKSVTIRERDSTKQERVKIDELLEKL